MQGDDRLAGAGAAGDLGDAARGGADRLVLVGLDRRDDVAHPPRPAPGQGGQQRAVAEDHEILGRLGREQVVLDADDLLAAAAQDAAAHDAVGLHRRRAVEGGGGRGAPVDDERFVFVVAHPESADVADLALGLGRRLLVLLRAVAAARGDRVVEVEPPEDEALVLTVEGVLSASGGEDEGVALEEPGDLLVAHVAGAVGAPARHPLDLDEGRSGARLLELGVDPVDVRLLARELTREDLRGLARGLLRRRSGLTLRRLAACHPTA